MPVLTVADDDSERLRQEMRRLAANLAGSVLESTEERNTATFQDLARLERLLAAMEASKPKVNQTMASSKLRAAFGALLVVAVVSSSFILPISWFTPIEIEGEVVASAIAFDVAKSRHGPAEVATREIAVSTLHVSSFGVATALGWRDAEMALQTESEDGGAVSASAPPDTPITLDLPRMIPETTVYIGRTRTGNQFHVGLSGANKRFAVQAVLPEGSTLSTEANGWTERTESTRHLSLEGENEINLAFTPVASVEGLFAAVVQVSGFDFEQTSVVGDIFPVSSIHNGAIYLRDFGDRKVTLRRGQAVGLSITDGVIRSLDPSENGWRLTFAAKVKQLDIDGRSAMPSVLEYWHASSIKSLVWTSTVAAFAIFIGLMRWFGLM